MSKLLLIIDYSSRIGALTKKNTMKYDGVLVLCKSPSTSKLSDNKNCTIYTISAEGEFDIPSELFNSIESVIILKQSGKNDFEDSYSFIVLQKLRIKFSGVKDENLVCMIVESNDVFYG